MFKAFFVAKTTQAEQASIHIFCRFRNKDLGVTTELPSSQNLGNFCFPLGAEHVKPKEYAAPEEYSFTLTGGDGSHLHGFCRCFLPPRSRATIPARKNSNLRYPQVLCLISPFPWFPFYFKVLQIVETLLKQNDLLITCDTIDLPETAAAAVFLCSLLQECKGKPQLGRVIKVPLPGPQAGRSISPQRRIQGVDGGPGRPLLSTSSFIELQIPPDTGNGSWNAGIPLARVFWHLPSGTLMALIQALLLERRIVMVAQDRDTLSASLHAAAALLYPFRWHHIYLPFLPHNLKDYLNAPMPYLIGIPAPQLLPGLQHMGLEEVVFVDLDAGTCTLGSQAGPPMDYALLPWAHHLQSAFQVVYQMLRSPTEFDSTPLIGHCMQEYFLKLLGSYREFVELDAPIPQAEAEVGGRPSTGGVRQQVQDDGYLRAHGFRFDHLSFVAHHRRSEKARNFLDLMRHSQMYEVFINERLALAAGYYKTSDAFEAKVGFLLSKKGKVLGLVAQAGARGVSNISAVLQRTSTLVKSGVSQIRQSASQDFHGGEGVIRPPHADETIVPSYSIDMGIPEGSSRPEQEPSSLSHALPSKDEDPTTFFNHDHDSEEDAPPVVSPTQSLSPTRRPSTRSVPNLAEDLPFGRRRSSELASPRATGITNGGDGSGFASLLNLDGVDGVFAGQASAPPPPQEPGRPNLSINLSLLDEDAGPETRGDAAGGSFDLSSWGLGLPSVSEATSSVMGWASSLQAMAFPPEADDRPPSNSPGPQTSSWACTPSYDLDHLLSLGTINPFSEFESPEAMRASSSTHATTGTATPPQASGARMDISKPVLDVSPVQARQAEAWTSEAHRRSSTGGTAQPIASRGLHLGSSASSADDKPAVIGDPFSILDPLHRPASKAEPMLLSRSSKSWDVTEPGHGPSASVVSSTDASFEKQLQPGCPQDIETEESKQGLS